MSAYQACCMVWRFSGALGRFYCIWVSLPSAWNWLAISDDRYFRSIRNAGTLWLQPSTLSPSPEDESGGEWVEDWRLVILGGTSWWKQSGEERRSHRSLERIIWSFYISTVQIVSRAQMRGWRANGSKVPSRSLVRRVIMPLLII